LVEKFSRVGLPMKETNGQPVRRIFRSAGTTHEAMADAQPLRRTIALTRAGASLAVSTVASSRGDACRRATRANFTDVLPASITSIGYMDILATHSL
jgi:hypothetical protein